MCKAWLAGEERTVNLVIRKRGMVEIAGPSSLLALMELGVRGRGSDEREREKRVCADADDADGREAGAHNKQSNAKLSK